ncbi:class I SAM-dependent methyltransferase [Streptomyces sp. NPDC049687]|uniref:class I SAM-dependent methyltransferase n=1 Tax=Streptomyces sp. NPDC049687 TaxID=3365596 RepID=UPI00378DD64E
MTDALEAFLGAPDSDLHSALRQLDQAFRSVPAGEGQATATEAGHAAVPALVAAAAGASPSRLPHLLLLLGLLADTDAHDAVRDGLADVLPVFELAAGDRRTVAALLFLAGHFPEDAERILAAADGLALSPDDRSRLERSLAGRRQPGAVLARVWPSPAMWAVTEAERAADGQWHGMMPEEQLEAMWQSDTRALRDYAASKAIALLDTPAAPYTAAPDHVEPEREQGRAASQGVDAVERLAPFEKLLACPDCTGALSFGEGGARCAACGKAHPAGDGWLDLSSAAGQGMEAMILNDVAQVSRYERGLRPAFLRVMGRDFDDLLDVDDEIRFLTTNARPTEGPVLDLAAGSGRFTRVLAEELGPDRVVALDLSTSMLAALQAAGPQLPAVRGSAVNLPFADASLTAVSCWNALQTLPYQGQVIAEIGRVLQSGGTFTLFTFLPDEDPLYREFQARQEKALRVHLYPREVIRKWLAEAGLTIREETGPGSYLFITAVRENRP